MKKRKSKKFRLLLEELHYWQSQYRMERRWLRLTKEKIKRIAEEMKNALEIS